MNCERVPAWGKKGHNRLSAAAVVVQIAATPKVENNV
jgi:hypothetical protein